MIIGIAGCSKAGKSTLADFLIWEFRLQDKTTIVLHLDDFVKQISKIIQVRNKPDWESEQSINTKLLLETISFFNNQKIDILIIEGYHLLAIHAISKLCDCQIMIELNEETFFDRRKKETRWGVEEEWYLNHVWKTWIKDGQKFIEKSKLILVNGEKPFDTKQIIEQITLKI